MPSPCLPFWEYFVNSADPDCKVDSHIKTKIPRITNSVAAISCLAFMSICAKHQDEHEPWYSVVIL
uniref:Uncharacterized protein n=1 Tax=Arundo donax TaxID=35708 RepID=A0A0A9FK99_ARUDO